MTESRVLSNISYTIHNNSNYDIITEETRGIVDVPYYPAQNLVDVSKKINPYTPTVDCYVPFYDQNNTHRLYGLVNRTDARFVFIEFADNARYVQYKFAGNSYPQSRSFYAYSYEGTNLYILGGYANSRCLNDLWQYNINTDQWTNLNFALIETGSNQLPSRRRKSNLVATENEVLLFGGETDTLTINTANPAEFIVPLNDVWSYTLATNTWINYDPNRVLPHRQGHIIYNSASVIKIYIIGGLNDIGVLEPNAIWTVDKSTNVVTSQSITAPFTPAYNNCCVLIGSNIHVFLNNGSVYKWDNTNTQFVLIRSSVAAINPYNGFYWTVTSTSINYGNNAGMGSFNTSVARLYNDTAVLQSTKTITLPPKGVDIPSVNIGNVQTFFYGGMYTYNGTNTFNESTYILNHTTLNVQKYDFDSSQRPTERVFPSLAYDSYNGRVWLFGGFDGSKFYNDLWYFDLGLHVWVLVHAQQEDVGTSYPPPRYKAGMAVVNTNFLYIIGGYSDANSFGDFWSYNTSNGNWDQIFTTDNIPWGSQYSIFQWRDRLWMFNGQQLYRYFYDIKQFKAQPFLMNEDSTFDPVTKTQQTNAVMEMIRAKKYMDSPVRVTCINDHLLVQNGSLAFDVDLDTKIVLDLTNQYDIVEQIYWLDRYLGISIDSMAAYFTNVSAMQPLTKNQIPHSYKHRSVSIPIPSGVIYHNPLESDTKMTYQDSSGVFKIQGEYLAVDKATLIYDNNVSYIGLQSKLTDGVNFNDSEAVWNKTIEIMGKPTTYPVTPWFLYNKYKSTIGIYEGAQATLYNDSTDSLYIVYNNGNTLKFNADDNTFFTYFTKLWEGAAFGYHKLQNKIYAFGGIRNDRTIYLQDGMSSTAVGTTYTSELTGTVSSGEKTHNGLLQFDLNINEMNLGSIETYQKERNVTLVDYPVTRDYLVDLIRKYIEGYSNNTIPNSLDDVKRQIYLATQPMVDDLSQFDFVFENGIRPSARAFSAFTQIGNKMYIFGGCECFESDCSNVQYPSPWNVCRPGTMLNAKRVSEGHAPIYDVQAESMKAVCFDMDTHTWINIASIPSWRYMASAIPSSDNNYIYIIGGYTDINCTVATTKITVYDVVHNTYEDLKGIPSTYKARALPILHWLDEDRLLIQYGFYTYNKCRSCDGCLCCTYYHLPRTDAWIYDTKNNIMYKAFEDIDIQASIVAKDSFYIGESKENTAYSLSVSPDIDGSGNLILKALSWDLVKGLITPIKIIPTTEIVNDYDAFDSPTLESMIDKMSGDITLDSIINFRYNHTNFRFRYCWIEEYGEYNHKHMFVIGERSDTSGITYLEDIARGFAEAHLRFWYVDLEATDNNRYLHSVTYTYPLPLSPVMLAYDGSRYIYAIYNKYNIWRLDFKGVMTDSSGSYWYQCPPCIDCNFLGESRTNSENGYNDPWNAFFTKPNYLTLISNNGRMARMDTNTFVWYLDKEEAPQPPTIGSVLVAGSEIENDDVYLYDLGGVSGKVLNVYEKQWDNFFLDMRNTSKVAVDFKSVIEHKLWPTFLRRKRMYIMNQLGHIFYTWLRIDGQYDIEFQLQDFYDGSEIRIYGDYTLLQNKNNIILQVFGINSGWVTINSSNYTTVTNEIGWDWDGDYSRRYVHMFIDSMGNTAYNYSELPPNYVSVNLVAGMGGSEPISKIRVAYKNVPEDYNYMSRINKVELISDQNIVDAYDTDVSLTPLSIVHIEPITIDDEFSNQFAVHIKNTGDHPATNVMVYAYGNTWIQFNVNPTLYPDGWTIRNETNPFIVSETINPGLSAVVYIRAVNIDSKPHSTDLVVKGVYAFA
jgi:hypothetical protein